MSLPVIGRGFNILGGGQKPRKLGIVPAQYPFVVYRHDDHGQTGQSCKHEDGDGDNNFWLSFQRANDAYGPALLGWPSEYVIDCLTDSFPPTNPDGTTDWKTPDGYTREKLKEDTASNEAALLHYDKMASFPRGDRVAIIGRAPSSEGFSKGESLNLQGAKNWEPNLSIYCNWTPDKPVRVLASRSSQRWLLVMDRRVGVNVLDGLGSDGSAGEFIRWDGLFVSLAASPALIAAAILRRIPIVAIDYREGPPGFYRQGFCRVRHVLGAGPLALLMVGQGAAKPSIGVTKPASVLICGLDGNQKGVAVPPPPKENATDEEIHAAILARGFAIDQIGQYYDLGTASAGVAFYLDQLGIRVHHIAGAGTPYHVATVGLTSGQIDVIAPDREVSEKTEAQA